MKLRIVFLSALLTLLFGGSAARADYTFLFTDASGTASNIFTVAQGQTIDIRVYLSQTGASTGLSAQGLNSGGVQLNTAAPSIATVTGVAPNAAFDNKSTTTGANANVTENQISNPAVKAPTSGPDANRILLGTFTFTASGVNTGTTLTVTAIPSTGTSVNVIAPGGPDSGSIDGIIQNASASITVTAVPEPGSLVLAGLAAAGFGAGVLRRRFLGKKPQPAAPAE
jgi:hypothetical protein